MTRRDLLRTATVPLLPSLGRSQTQRSNVVIILADDLGFGDLGCYGSLIRTPNLDRMAAAGFRSTAYYAPAPVCSPSRAGLLTGRYPVRTGVTRVLQPADKDGLALSEATIANLFGAAGYATACVGKWHLGSQPEFFPTERGFGEFFGLLYSHDMYPLRLLQGAHVVEENPPIATLTERWTSYAKDFIRRSAGSPFFLYLAHTAPHIPLAARAGFRGKSGQGLYGDVVRELDWSYGAIRQALDDAGVADNTIVIFTSDNGPWYQGSAGPFRGRKDEIFEGGMRMPFIARWPNRIPAGIVSGETITALDICSILAAFAGIPLPAGLDGIDASPLLLGQQETLNRQDPFLYFDGVHLQAARLGPWKLHVARFNSPPWLPPIEGGRWNLPLKHLELYNLDDNPGEDDDVSDDYPEVVDQLWQAIQRLLPNLPREIQDDWRDTQATAVEDTPPGAWPVRKMS